MKRTLGLALAIVMLVPAGAAGQDDACVVDLWQAPLAEAELPVGWSLQSITPNEIGLVSLRYARAIDADEATGTVSVTLFCVADAVVFMQVIAAADAASNRDRLAVTMVGDETTAVRAEGDFVTLRWRHGDDIIGRLEPVGDGVTWDEVEAIALAIEGQLP